MEKSFRFGQSWPLVNLVARCKSLTLLSEARDFLHLVSREVSEVDDKKTSDQALGVIKQHWK